MQDVVFVSRKYIIPSIIYRLEENENNTHKTNPNHAKILFALFLGNKRTKRVAFFSTFDSKRNRFRVDFILTVSIIEIVY